MEHDANKEPLFSRVKSEPQKWLISCIYCSWS